MTDLQKMYLKTRMEGLGHTSTLIKISKATGIDEDSISRSLARAKREDDRHAKKGAK